MATVAIYLLAELRYAIILQLLICCLTTWVLVIPSDTTSSGLVDFAAFISCVVAGNILLELINARSVLGPSDPSVEFISDATPGFSWSAHPDGRLNSINSRVLGYLGVSHEEMNQLARVLGATWWHKFVHPNDVDRCIDRWATCLATGESFSEEQRIRRHDGTYRWLRESAIASRDSNGNVTAWFASSEDIDDQKKAEIAIRDNQRLLQQMIDTIPALIWRASADGVPSYINNPLIAWTGISFDQNSSGDASRFAEAIVETLHPDDHVVWRDALENARKTGTRFDLRYRQKRHDGVYRWIDGKAEPLRDSFGNIIQWCGVCLDITDQIEASEAARRSERELRLLVDTVPSLIWLMTPGGMPYYFNKPFVDWSGQSIAAAVEDGDTSELIRFVHPEDRAGVEERIQTAISSGEPFSHKGRLRRKDGEYRWMHSRAQPLRNEDGKIVRWYGVNLDIDDEVRAHDALRRSDERLSHSLRVTSLSELSVSIAHELNQPLQALVANSHALQRWLDADPPNLARAYRTAHCIVKDADTAAQVVSRIRALFGKNTFPRQEVDVNRLVADVCSLIADKLSSGAVKIHTLFSDNLPTTSGDQVQLEQVLINLIRNASDAMQSIKGDQVITISTTLKGSDLIEVEVRDTGPGIADPEKIFAPFFTTKKDGMGMGLAICRSIIEAHQGQLRVETLKDGGAAVAFSIPVRALEASAPGPADRSVEVVQ
ncbi:PAS domain-containing protein [Agrobacterium tumefaciens]|uniref:PAS domain-containing protein n=1 Tax=Agrobacterium tumefaciens TaxID=358 RepID=UPI00287BDB00|nr:PAS domain-containing protein [Agrobacterium tumefaciens]MDS7598502.1 PAS domain-containing protein [Agrobacterium tumefaciens]